MPSIELETKIQSEIETCFDLSRSIDLHKISTSQTNETAIDGRIKGLINYGEFVTWKATHLGIEQKLTSKITAYNRPFHFQDRQIKGIFKFIVHDHYFEKKEETVIMKDVFEFQSKLGIIGRLLDKLLLTNYLSKLLINRNKIIREYAETNKWKSVLNDR